MKIDVIDAQILQFLNQNSRLSIRELSKKVNLSAPSVAERVRKLEDEGIIEGYTTKINYDKLGFNIHAVLEVKTKNGQCERFRAYMKNYPRAVFCYRVAGPTNYIVKISARSFQEVEAFIDAVSKFAETVTHVIFSEVGIGNNVLDYYSPEEM